MAVIGTFAGKTFYRLKPGKPVATITPTANAATPAPTPGAMSGQPMGLLLTLTYP